MPEVESFTSADAPVDRLVAVRRLCDKAFEGDLTDVDWHHALGGWHVLIHADGLLVAHAAVVARTLLADDRILQAGYVEAVATEPARRRRGFGSLAMRELTTRLTARYEFGAVSTGKNPFFERLGWERWCGPTFVRTQSGLVRTVEEDDGIMVLRFGPTSDIDLNSSLTCTERSGDDW